MNEEAEAKMVSQEEHDGLKAKLDEFRTNNVKLMKDIASLQSQFDGVDISDYREMVKSRDEQKDKKLIDSGKIDELLDERTKRMREDHNKVTGKMEEENSILTRQLEGITIDNAIRDQAIKHGIASTAIQDVILRAKVLFKLKDGKATPFDSDGNVVFASGASTPMSIEEWMKGLTVEAPHLFAPSNGAGSQHGNRGGGDAQTVRRSEFEEWSQGARSKFSLKGGKVVD